MSIAVELVFSNGEDDELKLGPFTQGVVIGSVDVAINDIASGLMIAQLAKEVGGPTRWMPSYWASPDDAGKLFDKVFIHGA